MDLLRRDIGLADQLAVARDLRAGGAAQLFRRGAAWAQTLGGEFFTHFRVGKGLGQLA